MGAGRGVGEQMASATHFKLQQQHTHTHTERTKERARARERESERARESWQRTLLSPGRVIELRRSLMNFNCVACLFL